MKIAVTATGDSMQSAVDERFARCQYFIIVDSETMESVAVKNPNINARGGAGPAAASKIAELGANIIITGNIGMNAQQALEAADIKVVTQSAKTVKEAVENYLNKEL